MTVSAPGPKATEIDTQLIKALEGRFRADTSSDNDKFGKPIDAYEAVKSLNAGRSVVFEHAKVGTVGKGRYPERRKIFRGRPTTEDGELATKALRRNNYRGEGIRISSYVELREMAAIECYVDALGGHLTEDETGAAKILRKLEGVSTLSYTEVTDRDDFGRIFYYKSDKVDPREVRGLYDPENKKGGILGMGSRCDRLTAYEALCKLRDGQPVMIRERGGQESTVANVDDLLLYDQLK